MKQFLLFSLALALCVALRQVVIAQAQSSAQLQFEPATLQLAPQATSTMKLMVTGISNLYAFDIFINYDPAVVTLLDADPDTAGVQVALGSALTGKQFFMAENKVSDGVIRLSGTLIAPETPLTGDSDLFTLNWQGQTQGQTALTFSHAVLINNSNHRLEAITSTGQIHLGGPIIALSGEVKRQGQTDQTGITITRIQQTLTNTQQTFQTQANGHFALMAMGLSHYRLNFTATNYLSAWLEGEASVSDINIGTVTLLGGDVTGDNEINIFDLALIGSRYQSSDSTADLTGDGQVDIFDMALAAGNYGKQGPVQVVK